jgi:hypothetical protein
MLNSSKYGEHFLDVLNINCNPRNCKTNKTVFIPRNNFQKHIIWISPCINIICNIIQGSKNYELERRKKKTNESAINGKSLKVEYKQRDSS